MKRPYCMASGLKGVVLALVLAIAGCGSRQPEKTEPVEPERVIDPASADNSVTLSNVKATGALIAGTLVNNSGREVDDIHLLVNHSFLWKNERNPGRNNPSRTDYYRVAKPIPPGAAMTFEYRPNPPLPKRSDGKFVTTVEVMSFSEVYR